MANRPSNLLALALVAGVVAVGVATFGLFGAPGAGGPDAGTEAMTTFESEAAFQEYLERGGGERVGGTGASRETGQQSSGGDAAAGGGDGDSGAGTATPAPTEAAGDAGDATTRVGTTNVQVGGVDEPDLLKTDGSNFYYAPLGRDRPRSHDEADEAGEPDGSISVLDVDEPAAPAVRGEVDDTGTLLRDGDTLVVIGRDAVTGYDVSDPGDPGREWSHSLEGRLVTGRLVDGRVYLVLASPVDREDPCPVRPLGGAAGVDCTEIQRPTRQIDVDASYTTVALRPGDGSVTDETTVVGTHAETAVYATGDRLYLTYTEHPRLVSFVFDLTINVSTVFPEDVKDEFRSIRDANRSRDWKLDRASEVYRNWTDPMDDEERERVVETFRNETERYLEAHKREMTTTGVVGIALRDGLPVVAHGSVPGRPLNQFSLSEREGTLRVATTVPGMGGAETENDLYTLDAGTLDRVGSVQGMAPDQRIFAARYVGDTAYLVTFRQVDPFHVVDLSDPSAPEELGQVRLPGFSTYLHPLTDDRILGIGEESGRVKAVTFDASEPTDPVVEDDLRLDAGFSAVERSHHAFTIDRRHEVFFLPTGESGVIVDYSDGALSIETRVDTDGPAQRARYVGDYLYVFGAESVVVVDETTWETETRVPLGG
jgi:uncharacterized secreted protein with C-terminal beta-propeller domain